MRKRYLPAKVRVNATYSNHSNGNENIIEDLRKKSYQAIRKYLDKYENNKIDELMDTLLCDSIYASPLWPAIMKTSLGRKFISDYSYRRDVLTFAIYNKGNFPLSKMQK